MIVATIISIIVQYHAAKVGIITQYGISGNIRLTITSKVGRFITAFLVICAIFIGNCAFEVGNITGAALGVKLMFGSPSLSFYIVCTTVIVGVLLWQGKLSVIQNILKIVVILMTICFIIAAAIMRPDLSDIIREMFTLNFNENILLVGALIGTTVGPYNIFLHSEAASQSWHSPNDIKTMMADTILSIGMGGIISCCIIVVSASAANMLDIHQLSIDNFSKALEFPLGLVGQKIFLIGLFSAGISSAITAPLAASYTISALFSEGSISSKSNLFRSIWCIVLFFGLIISLLLGSSPANLILFAQYANALILPLVIMFLLYCLNSTNMGEYKNRPISNFSLSIILLICLLLVLKNFL